MWFTLFPCLFLTCLFIAKLKVKNFFARKATNSKKTKMEDDKNGRGPKWKMTKKKVNKIENDQYAS